jgi:7-carboxy-7-deazaguanine synthase
LTHTYRIKEIFKTLQGEGYWTGRPAIFVRFSGCNLWSGREEDRAEATCKFCDTDFLGGEWMTAAQVAEKASILWGEDRASRFMVCTGGEPSLQMDFCFVQTVQRFDFQVAMETNGTRLLDFRLDWITMSPKSGTEIKQPFADEIKIAYPQDGISPDQFREGFGHHFIQPIDGPNREANTKASIEYCLANPKWRLSLQTHKIIGLP